MNGHPPPGLVQPRSRSTSIRAENHVQDRLIKVPRGWMIVTPTGLAKRFSSCSSPLPPSTDTRPASLALPRKHGRVGYLITPHIPMPPTPRVLKIHIMRVLECYKLYSIIRVIVIG